MSPYNGEIDGATTEALPIAPSLAPTLEAADLPPRATLVDRPRRLHLRARRRCSRSPPAASRSC